MVSFELLANIEQEDNQTLALGIEERMSEDMPPPVFRRLLGRRAFPQ